LDGQILTRTVNITNPHGLHTRPCLAIVNAVRQHNAEVTVRKNGQTANAASILELMSLGAACGAELVLAATGPEAPQALDALSRLFANEFEIHYQDH
jgi:phosphotransferase system HPr (HPr) family protein